MPWWFPALCDLTAGAHRRYRDTMPDSKPSPVETVAQMLQEKGWDQLLVLIPHVSELVEAVMKASGATSKGYPRYRPPLERLLLRLVLEGEVLGPRPGVTLRLEDVVHLTRASKSNRWVLATWSGFTAAHNRCNATDLAAEFGGPIKAQEEDPDFNCINDLESGLTPTFPEVSDRLRSLPSLTAQVGKPCVPRAKLASIPAVRLSFCCSRWKLPSRAPSTITTRSTWTA